MYEVSIGGLSSQPTAAPAAAQEHMKFWLYLYNMTYVARLLPMCRVYLYDGRQVYSTKYKQRRRCVIQPWSQPCGVCAFYTL